MKAARSPPRWDRPLQAGRRRAAVRAQPRGAALHLPRRPGDAFAGPGTALAVSEGACGRAGGLVASRSGEEAGADVAADDVGPQVNREPISQKDSIEDMRRVSQKKGRKCLSDLYVDRKTELQCNVQMTISRLLLQE